MGKKVHDAALTIEEMKRRQAKVLAMFAEVRGMFSEAHGLAKDDRRLSQGRMGPDEAEALRGVVDAMDAIPAVFASLADEDDGHDPTKLETDLLRDRLDRHALYAELAEQCGELAKVFADTALVMAAGVKPVALAGYAIAKPISKRDDVLRSKIAKALDLYGSRSAAAAASRRANAEPNPKDNH